MYFSIYPILLSIDMGEKQIYATYLFPCQRISKLSVYYSPSLVTKIVSKIAIDISFLDNFTKNIYKIEHKRNIIEQNIMYVKKFAKKCTKPNVKQCNL